MMKYSSSLLLCILFLCSCLSDEERRLQTDQTFEGEEIFNITYSLDEHLMYAFQSYEYYQDTANHSAISGCPVVAVNDLDKEVMLTFGQGECATNRPLRSGKLVLNYRDTLQERPLRVRINYEEYWVRGIKLDGMRFLDQLDSTSYGISWLDSLINYKITNARNSSSKLEGVFTHEVHVDADSLLSFATTGSGTGRNLAGRPFSMQILQPRYYNGDCLRSGFFVAEEGEERWTIDRSVEANIIHSVRYQKADDCNHSALIQLADRNELSKTQ